MINYTYLLRFLIGLAITLAYTYAAFEYKSYEILSDGITIAVPYEEELIELPFPPNEEQSSPIVNQYVMSEEELLETEEKLLAELQIAWQQDVELTDDAFLIPEEEELQEIEEFEEEEFEEEIVVEEVIPEPIPEEEEWETVCVSFVEQSAMPQGGFKVFYHYLKKHLNYPEQYKHIGGKLHVSFVIERDGTLSDVKLLNSLHPVIDEAVLQVFEKVPAWIPGKQRGRAVRQRINIPIQFDCGRFCEK